MRTHYVGTVELDQEPLRRDLQTCKTLPWSEAYSEYVFGGSWKSCILWAPGGDVGDGVVTNYAYGQSCTFTKHGEQLPYLRELIATTADLTRLNFVRLALVVNSVIIPHRDLLELSELADDVRNAHRMHIPLATNENCFFNEDNVVYHMRQGEVWFLDASRIHSVAVLTKEPRIHMMFDFVDLSGGRPFTTLAGSGTEVGIPVDKIVTRPPISQDERAELLRLSNVLTMDTFEEIFSMVIKKHFRADGGEDFVWDTMTTIARNSRDPAVLPHAVDLRKHYTLERSA